MGFNPDNPQDHSDPTAADPGRSATDWRRCAAQSASRQAGPPWGGSDCVGKASYPDGMAEPVPSLPSYEDPRALLRRLRLGREEFC